ncbi:zinc-dependent alcohol dehydrogenase, partial [Demequina sp. SO4-18]|uniref:zinc-dependent alcohol dehydrogenase n=1 Tax=Demequina sp. SO4-18 TaxID=3401026 RepID=UPI003B5AF246
WCGTCRTCRAGQIQRCERGGIFGSGVAFGGLGGAMAEKVRVPWADSCLSLIPAAVTDAQALAVGDILSTGWTAVDRAVSAPGQTIVVLGAGPIGLSAVHAARLSGVRQVIAVDTVADRRAVAAQLGADRVVDPTSEDVAAVVHDLTAGRGAEAIVEAAGVPATIGSWTELAAIGATVSMVAIPGGPVDIPVGAMQMKNISLWTGLGDLGHMDMLLDLIVTGVLDLTPIFTETVEFADIERAIADFIDRKEGLIKPLITV